MISQPTELQQSFKLDAWSKYVKILFQKRQQQAVRQEYCAPAECHIATQIKLYLSFENIHMPINLIQMEYWYFSMIKLTEASCKIFNICKINEK